MSNLWIPGWQFAETVFDPLRTFLEESTPQVLSYASADQDWSSWCDAQLSRIPQGARLIGWSLGGMLACELARRSDRVSSVLVLQANTRFSGGPGLPEAVAEGFPAAPEVSLGGSYLTALDDARFIVNDAILGFATALAGVLLLFLYAFRRLGPLLFAALPLASGLLLAFGFAGLAVGTLSTATSGTSGST